MARYKAYRGRRRRGGVLVAVLLVVIALAAAAFFVLPEYLVYTEDGVRLDLPFLQADSSPSPSRPQTPAQIEVVVETPPALLPPSASPSPSPSPEPEAAYALSVPMEMIGRPDQLLTLKDFALEAGINEIVLEVKNIQGELADPAETAASVALLSEPGLTLTARLSAFRDNTITTQEGTFGVKHTSGVNWLDRNRLRWINPYIPEARQYVIDCVLACRDAGFERVLLDNLCFPYFGSLSAIGYGEHATVSHVSAMNTFLDELSARTEGLRLSAVVLEETLVSGSHSEAGQELATIQSTFDRIYYYVPDGADELLDGAVPIFSAADAGLRERLAQAGESGYCVISENGEFPIGAFER